MTKTVPYAAASYPYTLATFFAAGYVAYTAGSDNDRFIFLGTAAGLIGLAVIYAKQDIPRLPAIIAGAACAVALPTIQNESTRIVSGGALVGGAMATGTWETGRAALELWRDHPEKFRYRDPRKVSIESLSFGLAMTSLAMIAGFIFGKVVAAITD